LNVQFAAPFDASWAKELVALQGVAAAHVRGLRIAVPLGNEKPRLAYHLRFVGDSNLATIRVCDGVQLPGAKMGQKYQICLESPDSRALYWSVKQGTLPRGMELKRNGLITGVPEARGTSEFELLGTTPYHDAPFEERDLSVKAVRLAVE
jgi:hypothetical protein